MKRIIPSPPYANETELGVIMRHVVRQEGHKPKLPNRDPASVKGTAQANWRSMVSRYFENNPDPIYRTELTKILKIEADTLRRVCRSLVVAGQLRSKRTQTGVVYKSVSNKAQK